MSGFSHYPLQEAIYTRLSTDVSLLSSVSGVYDRPPQGTAFPYVTIGESQGSDWSTATTIGSEQLVSLHVWSREGGRKQAALIMERIYTLLHEADLTLEEQHLVLLRFYSSAIALEDDGFTYKGTLRFIALLEAL